VRSRLTVLKPGLVPYDRAFELQQRLATGVGAGADPMLILLEHPPTFTLGARGNGAHVLTSDDRLRRLGAEVIRTDRGGDVTFHGPGQVVGYGIVSLPSLGIGVRDYVRGLEQVILDTIDRFGITGQRTEHNRGVWVGDAKLAAIGVRVSRGVTTHGFALNVSTDLSWFDHIIPCGIAGANVTSMSRVTGVTYSREGIHDELATQFARQFGLVLDVLQEVGA
jgi:lipoate-protein ligase B